MTLTIDQLRAYLERREHEASVRLDNAHKLGMPGSVAKRLHEVYRELLEAIEKGELPK